MQTKTWNIDLANKAGNKISRRMLAANSADVRQMVSNDDSLDGFVIVSMARVEPLNGY